MNVTWNVEFFDEFEREFDALEEAVRLELLAQAHLLEQFGPQLADQESIL